jgi:hypothetical protein
MTNELRNALVVVISALACSCSSGDKDGGGGIQGSGGIGPERIRQGRGQASDLRLGHRRDLGTDAVHGSFHARRLAIAIGGHSLGSIATFDQEAMEMRLATTG